MWDKYHQQWNNTKLKPYIFGIDTINIIEYVRNISDNADANIQAQIDKEQERIDKAFDRIKPAIEQQNKIIQDAQDGVFEALLLRGPEVTLPIAIRDHHGLHPALEADLLVLEADIQALWPLSVTGLPEAPEAAAIEPD